MIDARDGLIKGTKLLGAHSVNKVVSGVRMAAACKQVPSFFGGAKGAFWVARQERVRRRCFKSMGAGTPGADLLPPKSASRRECPRQKPSRLLPCSESHWFRIERSRHPARAEAMKELSDAAALGGLTLGRLIESDGRLISLAE